MSGSRTITLPVDVWRSVGAALRDYLTYGSGDFGAEHIPDEHLLRAVKAAERAVGQDDSARIDEAAK